MGTPSCSEEASRVGRRCGQHSAVAGLSRHLVGLTKSDSLFDQFRPHTTVPYSVAQQVATFKFDRDRREYILESAPNTGGLETVKTAYCGDVPLPVSGKDNLIANIVYGTTKVQIAIYDAKNASEALITRTYLVTEAGVRTFISTVNTGLFPVARAGPTLTTSREVASANANAYFSILKYYEMMYCLFDRPGLVARDHCVVSLANIRFTNAFWSGFCMFFGNGGDRAVPGVHPLTALDVCGHELTHGLQTFTTEFVYQGESGALNESIADVFGTLLEFFVSSKADTPDWTIGEAFNFVIRDFANPKSRKQPTFVGGEFWVPPGSPEDEGGVHTNSGVTNFMCYLATNGVKESFTSDSGERVHPFPPLPNFNLVEYASAVYEILESSRLSPNCKLVDFAREIANTVDTKHSHEAGQVVAKCAAIVGLPVAAPAYHRPRPRFPDNLDRSDIELKPPPPPVVPTIPAPVVEAAVTSSDPALPTSIDYARRSSEPSYASKAPEALNLESVSKLATSDEVTVSEDTGVAPAAPKAPVPKPKFMQVENGYYYAQAALYHRTKGDLELRLNVDQFVKAYRFAPVKAEFWALTDQELREVVAKNEVPDRKCDNAATLPSSNLKINLLGFGPGAVATLVCITCAAAVSPLEIVYSSPE